MPKLPESKIKTYVRKVFYNIPGAKSAYQRWIFGKKGVHPFEGWGMTTETLPPWLSPGDSVARDFLKAHEALVREVAEGRFRISQYDKIKNKEEVLSGYMWRHYIVFWTARYAQSMTGGKHIVECGVCDGLTVYYAMSAFNKDCNAHLYDSWDAMLEEHLLKTEHKHLGDYDYLDIEDTRKNLVGFNTEFIKGYIPEVFEGREKPANVVWLHIDLNASIPTTASLEYFFDEMPSGSICLFDDYGGQAYTDTKKAVDVFFADKQGFLLPLPTGQAIFFKR
ncbi:MAG: hypothetical protein MN733_07620 [Nitrososphaera sp.]|nr:hypothetical protein [Nitrososphaera sp.]